MQKIMLSALLIAGLSTLTLAQNSSTVTTSFSARKVATVVSEDLETELTRIDFANTITAEDLERHLTIIASDEFEGRETGEAGQKKAAQYISAHFEKVGLAPGNKSSYLQPFDVNRNGWGEVFIEVDGKRFEYLKDFYGWSATNNVLDYSGDELVFIGYGIDDPKYSDYTDIDVKGKLVVAMAGEPSKNDINLITGTEDNSEWATNWKAKLEAAEKHGAKALLVISRRAAAQLQQKSFVDYLAAPGVELSGSGAEEENTLPNTMYITQDMAGELFGKKGKKIDKTIAKIDKKGKAKSFAVNAPVKFKVEKTSEVVQTENVLGLIIGTDLANEIVVVSAHYDHIGFNDEEIFNGADDDGSGTVTVLEIAEAMSKAAQAGKGPRRSILFLTVSGEEKGLLGSEYFADIEPVFPLESIVTDLNIDMVGRIDPEHEGDREYVYTIGSDFLSSDLHKISESVAAEYSDIKLDYRYNSTDDPNRFYYRSDHYNFAKHNIPVIFYFNGSHEDYHGAGDTVDKIQFDILEKRAKLVFHTLWEVANTEKAPEVDRVLEE